MFNYLWGGKSSYEDGSEFPNDRITAQTLNRDRLAWLEQLIGNKPSVKILWDAVNKTKQKNISITKPQSLHLTAWNMQWFLLSLIQWAPLHQSADMTAITCPLVKFQHLRGLHRSAPLWFCYRILSSIIRYICKNLVFCNASTNVQNRINHTIFITHTYVHFILTKASSCLNGICLRFCKHTEYIQVIIWFNSFYIRA